jgi:hypothetical protein
MFESLDESSPDRMPPPQRPRKSYPPRSIGLVAAVGYFVLAWLAGVTKSAALTLAGLAVIAILAAWIDNRWLHWLRRPKSGD